jgi:hypothetical protein
MLSMNITMDRATENKMGSLGRYLEYGGKVATQLRIDIHLYVLPHILCGLLRPFCFHFFPNVTTIWY